MSDGSFKDRLRGLREQSKPAAPKYKAPSGSDESWAQSYYARLRPVMAKLAASGIRSAPLCAVRGGHAELVTDRGYVSETHPDNMWGGGGTAAVFGRLLALLQILKSEGFEAGVYGYDRHEFARMPYTQDEKRLIQCSITGSSEPFSELEEMGIGIRVVQVTLV